jgi:hypothetical protein
VYNIFIYWQGKRVYDAFSKKKNSPSLTCSQIWLSLLAYDGNTTKLTKLEKKKNPCGGAIHGII